MFGPVLVVKTFRTEEEALEMANRTHYGLAAAVISQDLERCERVAHKLEAGVVWINCSQPVFPQAPWGGIKQSGIGREMGPCGLQAFLNIKQVTRFVDATRSWFQKTRNSEPRTILSSKGFFPSFRNEILNVCFNKNFFLKKK